MGLIINKSLEIVLEIIRLIIFYFALIVSLYFIFLHILFFLFPEEQIITQAVNNFPEIKLIWPEVIFLSFIGWIITFKTKKLTFVSPFSLKLDEQITYLITAFLFATFLKGSYLILAKLGNIFLVIIILVLFFVLPQIASFFLSFSLFDFIDGVKRLFREVLILIKTQPAPHLKPISRFLNRLPSIWSIFLILFSFFSFIIVTSFVFVIIIIVTTSYLDKKIKSENKLKQSFYISQIKPKIITYATKVTIKGYSLGWNWNNKAKIQSDYGVIPKDLWTDQKIVFITPLHLKEGRFKIWLERLEGDLSDKIISSNKVELELVPASKYSLFDNINLWSIIFNKEK